MVTTMKKPKRPRDSNQLAKMVVDMATGQAPRDDLPEDEPSDATVSEVMRHIGRKGGKKGGKARAEKLTAKQRSEIAKKAAKARWKKD